MENLGNMIANIEKAMKSTTDEKTRKQLKKVLDSWAQTENILSGDFLDQESKTITLDGVSYKLTQQEFKTLMLLANTDRPLNRDEILQGAWDFAFVGPRTVDVHIRKLRKKLGANIIETRKGVGYKLAKKLTIC